MKSWDMLDSMLPLSQFATCSYNFAAICVAAIQNDVDNFFLKHQHLYCHLFKKKIFCNLQCILLECNVIRIYVLYLVILSPFLYYSVTLRGSNVTNNAFVILS